MNLTPKNNLNEFNRFLFKEIDLSLYQYKFLKDYLDNAARGQKPIYNSSVINTSPNGWILILHGETLLIYGKNWTERQFQEINEIFNLNNYTNYLLSGDSDLIEALIKFYQPKNIEVQKRRLFYRSDKINIFNTKDFKIRAGSLDELSELSTMLKEYYHEEYNGFNDKTIEEMQKRILSVILTKKIYILLDSDETLLSFCTIINPEIGILFTKNEHRNKGFGRIILSYCSILLQRENGIVYLMTDRDRIESNTVCEAVGYKPYYKYTLTKINYG